MDNLLRSEIEQELDILNNLSQDLEVDMYGSHELTQFFNNARNLINKLADKIEYYEALVKENEEIEL